VTKLLRIVNAKEKPLPQGQLSNRGYRHWSDLINSNPPTASEMEHLGEVIEKPFDDFFGF